jgi:trypsin-like peptidase
MTRRSVLLVAGLCTVAALGMASDAMLGGPVTGTLLHSDSGHAVLDPAHRYAGGAGADPVRAAAGQARRRAVPGHASRTGSDPRTVRDSDSTVAFSGTEEAGEQQEVTKQVDYSGAPVVRFDYPGASYVKVHFDRMLLRPGDWVTVTDPSGDQKYTYHSDPRLLRTPGDSPSTSSGDGFWAMSITGDTAVVTLHKTLPGPGLGKFGLDIDRVAHGFTSSEKATRAHNELLSEGGRSPESVCGTDDSEDAVCYRSSDPVAYQHSLPVARLLINGTTLCTAWRLTADDRMITNNHCLGSQSDVSNTEVWFNYQCTTCGGNIVAPVTKVPGDQLLSTDQTLDYTLFTVGDFDSIKNFGYLGLDLKTPRKGEQVYIPQHPEGDPTKLSIASDQDPNSTCQIDQAEIDGYAHDSDTAYRCDTEPGSSGSPVIDRKTNKVIALHHLGGCPNTGVRMSLIYQRIKSQL